MKKYPNFKKEILVDNLTELSVDYFECYYIKQYDSMNTKKGYNRESGGHLNKQLSEETKRKISEFNKGRHLSEETKKKLSIGKTILQYSKDNVLLDSWWGTREIENKLGIYHSHITECCLGKRKSAGGYKWKYAEEK